MLRVIVYSSIFSCIRFRSARMGGDDAFWKCKSISGLYSLRGMNVDLTLNLVCKIGSMINKKIYLPLSFAFLSVYFIYFHGKDWNGLIIGLILSLIGLFFAFKNIILKEENRQIKVIYSLIVLIALLFLILPFLT